jgi:hypothetical protein
VTLVGFTALRTPGGVDLHWRTTREARLLGFRVWRSVHGGGWTKLNARLIQAKGAGGYRYLDRRARVGEAYTYKLQMVSVDGSASWVGPVAVPRQAAGRSG